MRTFDTGATRDSDENKLDYEGFLSPLVIERFGQFMHQHRIQADGNLRESDNWQKGMPLSAYIKSLWRHFLNVWKRHRGHPAQEDIEDALCGVLFNAQGYLHELLKEKERNNLDEQGRNPSFVPDWLPTQSSSTDPLSKATRIGIRRI